MDNAALSIALSGGVALVTAAITAGLTYYLTKRREHEADWRKLKLERYGEYVTALSGVVRRDPSSDAQARYADAVNSIVLVALSSVLIALYAFQDEKSGGAKRESLLNSVMDAPREDIYPGPRRRMATVAIRFMGVPARSTVHS